MYKILKPLEKGLFIKLVKKVHEVVTQQNLKNAFDYSHETGMFTRKIKIARWNIGQIAGSLNKVNGYHEIRFLGKLYTSHRLAWLYTQGEFPVGDIDHIDGNRSNNRLSNLRESSRAENLKNISKHSDNISGYKGVSWSKVARKWHARCTNEQGKYQHLGYFSDKEDAAKAYNDFAKVNHGLFYRDTTKELNVR